MPPSILHVLSSNHAYMTTHAQLNPKPYSKWVYQKPGLTHVQKLWYTFFKFFEDVMAFCLMISKCKTLSVSAYAYIKQASSMFIAILKPYTAHANSYSISMY